MSNVGELLLVIRLVLRYALLLRVLLPLQLLGDVFRVPSLLSRSLSGLDQIRIRLYADGGALQLRVGRRGELARQRRVIYRK